jgi:hypothetical protein
VARGAKQQVGRSVKVGGNIGAGEQTTGSDMKWLDLLYKVQNRTSFKTSTDFILAVQLRRIKLKANGELSTVTLSTRNASLADGSARQEQSGISGLEFDGLEDSLEDAKEDYTDGFEEREDVDGNELVIPNMD